MDSNYSLYYSFVSSIYPLSDENFKLLLNHSKSIKFSPKEKLVELGKKSESLYLLIDGVVRSYVILESGKEVTKSLFAHMELCSPLTSLIKKESSKIIFETLTDCAILELKYADFKELCDINIEILKLYVTYLEKHFIKNEERHLELLSMNARERYLALRKRIPNIDNLIPQYQIAAYLNITPVQLSRIRSQLK